MAVCTLPTNEQLFCWLPHCFGSIILTCFHENSKRSNMNLQVASQHPLSNLTKSIPTRKKMKLFSKLGNVGTHQMRPNRIGFKVFGIKSMMMDCSQFKSFSSSSMVSSPTQRTPIVHQGPTKTKEASSNMENLEKNEVLKKWEIIRSRILQNLPKGSSKFMRELDRLMYQYVSSRRSFVSNKVDGPPNYTLITSLNKLAEHVQSHENDRAYFPIYLELITVSCYFGYLPLALHLVNFVHSDFKVTLDYSTYKSLVGCFIENGKYDECFNFIVDLEEKHGIKPNYQLYLPLYLKLKETISKNDKKSESHLLSAELLNSMIPRLSENPNLINEIIANDIFSVGLIGSQQITPVNMDDYYGRNLVTTDNSPYYDYQDMDHEENHNGAEDEMDECDECCGHHHHHGEDEPTIWNHHDRHLFRRHNEWENPRI